MLEIQRNAPSQARSTVADWRRSFEARQGRHRGRPTAPATTLSPAVLAGLRSSLPTLMVAEVISLRFYAVLRDGVGDPTLESLFGHIQDDEEFHVRFHLNTRPTVLATLSGPRRSALRLLHRAAMTGSIVLVAADHRRALDACGISSSGFVQQTQRRSRQIATEMWRQV